MSNFGERLRQQVLDRSPLCVGIDPSTATLARWERPDNVDGVLYVALTLVEVASAVTGVVKPQVAFFERFGSAGLAALERVIAEASNAGLIVIADAKRGDIGSTNDGYAQAWLSPRSPLSSDALTVSPYLGVAAMESLRHACESFDRGLFVVVASSNPEGQAIQAARDVDGQRVDSALLEQLASLNDATPSVFGAVIGATRHAPQFPLSRLGAPFLVPGVGAQGGTSDDVAHLFTGVPTGSVVVNVGRAISDAGPERRAVTDAARRWRDDVVAALL